MRYLDQGTHKELLLARAISYAARRAPTEFITTPYDLPTYWHFACLHQCASLPAEAAILTLSLRCHPNISAMRVNGRSVGPSCRH